MKKKITLVALLFCGICTTCFAREVYRFLSSCGIPFYMDLDRLRTPEDFEAMYIMSDQTLCPENWDIDQF